MDLLKLALITSPALVSLIYSEKANEIILALDASLEGWEEVLMQLIQDKKHPSRYENAI